MHGCTGSFRLLSTFDRLLTQFSPPLPLSQAAMVAMDVATAVMEAMEATVLTTGKEWRSGTSSDTCIGAFSTN